MVVKQKKEMFVRVAKRSLIAMAFILGYMSRPDLIISQNTMPAHRDLPKQVAALHTVWG